jgi:ABC-2 type transport system permease protein
MAVAQMPTVAGARSQPSGNNSLNVLKSEWTKIRSIRSTYWTLLTAAVLTIGLSAIVCAVFVAQFSHLKASDLATFNASSTSLTGGILAQFAIAVLGVLVITGEYATGMIRTTFAAVPQRLNVLWAKVVVFSIVTFVVTSAACFAAFFIGQGILSAKHIGVSISAPNALRTVVGTAVYLTVLGVLSLGVGVLLRKTAGAICAVVGILFVVPVLAGFLPSSLDAMQKFLPSNAGQAIIDSGPHQAGATAQLTPWVGMGVFALYAIGLLVLGAVLMQRRDA